MPNLFKGKDEISCNELRDSHFGDHILSTKELINNHFSLKENQIYKTSAFLIQILICIMSGFAAGLFCFIAYYKEVGIADIALLPFVLVLPLLSITTIFWIIKTFKSF